SRRRHTRSYGDWSSDVCSSDLNGGHDGGMHVCMTGHSSPTPETPYFGSVVARLRPATCNVPSYVWLQNLAGDVQPRYLTGGFLEIGRASGREKVDVSGGGGLVG